MRKEYRRELKKAFQKQLQSIAPEYELVKLKSMYVDASEMIFRRVVNDNLHLFILLVPHHHGMDQFTIEVGWSKKARFPELGIRPSPPFQHENAFSLDEYVCRIGTLDGSGDRWWQVGKQSDIGKDPLKAVVESTRQISSEEAQYAVEKPVNASIESVRQFCLPFLNKLSDVK